MTTPEQQPKYVPSQDIPDQSSYPFTHVYRAVDSATTGKGVVHFSTPDEEQEKKILFPPISED